MSSAIEALLVFEEVQPLAFGDIMDALKELQPTLSQALRSVTGFLQINGSFLNTFKVPWPAELRSLLATFGALNLDFVDPDAASRWLGRSMHYGTATLASPHPSPSPDPKPRPKPSPSPEPGPSPNPEQARPRSGYASPSSSFCWPPSSASNPDPDPSPIPSPIPIPNLTLALILTRASSSRTVGS